MTNISTSLYAKTTKANNYVSYLDFWSSINIPANVSDKLISLDSRYNHRPDLLSYDEYGTPQLWWVFILRNPDVIKDPTWDFVTGINIYIPLKTTLTGYI